MPDVPSGAVAPSSRRAAEPEADRISLPKPLTSFIGRERELAEAKELLQGSYLVTLTGPGGSGKTRLCIALAAQVAEDYPDGVYFVPLAPVRDPGLVPSTIAQSIGLQDARDRPLMEHLVSQLRERQILIVLDNFEHLLPGAPVVTRLLQETRELRILVSSRSSLRISGEQECPVPPLAVPDPGVRPTAASLGACESVRLFAERAVAAVPGFELDDENAPAVAEIARRLDGLPLAIELAAARVKLLPPGAILPRLEHSLGLLTGGGRDLPDRQQTLRATIGWSYDLLTEGAGRLLATCSVFAGGASLEIIETVCGAAVDIGLPVLDGWTVLDRIRDLSEVPVLLLTSHAQEADKVRGLRAGADDYVSKPFGNAELLARVEALLRRASGSQAQPEPQPQPQPEPEPGVYDDGLVQVGLGGPGGGQAGAGEVSVQGRPVRLTPTEYRLLTALVRHPSQVLSPDQLLAQAWQDPAGIGPDRVKFAVMRLRRKLGPDGAGRIEAVRGFGYRYRPPAT